MALTANQTKLNELYQKNFGRTADYDTTGGGSYWLKTHNPQTDEDWAEIDRMLGASAEAKSFTKDGVVRPGGVKRNQSVYSQGVGSSDPNAANYNPNFNEYAAHFQTGGALAGQNSANTLNQIAANTYKPMPESDDPQATVMPSVDGGYFQFADQDVTAQPTLPGAPKTPGTEGWWNEFENADAFKEFLQPTTETETETKTDNGMGDFMKFMMLMNVMGGSGGFGGGGGYGGSQFGYGGMNPGGVQAAYDPVASLQSMGTWFKDMFGQKPAAESA